MIITQRLPSRYGWKRDTPDFRDHLFLAPPTGSYPPVIDNRGWDWGIYDQGQIGSCTANAVLSAFRNVRFRANKIDFDGSRLAQYYWARYIEGGQKSDSGAELRDAMKVLSKFGVAADFLWPYVESKVLRGPPKSVSVAATSHKITGYQSVAQTEAAICGAVKANGNVVIGIAVYDSFESKTVANSGIVPLPSNTETLLGGHAMEVIGYDLTGPTKTALVKNSWGTSWGQNGYCTIPLSYLTNPQLAGDFWTIIQA